MHDHFKKRGRVQVCGTLCFYVFYSQGSLVPAAQKEVPVALRIEKHTWSHGKASFLKSINWRSFTVFFWDSE